MRDRTHIQQWARSLLDKDSFVILDTETTGLEKYAEIIEIAVIDRNGTPLLNTLIRPQGDIPEDAIAVHGITHEMTTNAPAFPDIWPTLLSILAQRPHLLIYNAEYDFPLLWYAAKRYDLQMPTISYQCLMKIYAHYAGLCATPRNCRCRWQKLETACLNIGVKISRTHRAFFDARLTLSLLEALGSYGNTVGNNKEESDL